MVDPILTKMVAAGIPAQKLTQHHYKYGPLNFYPKRGIIHRDGAEASNAERGLDVFIELCRTYDLNQLV